MVDNSCCRFCSDDIRKQGIIYEDRRCYVVLNEFPVNRGHLLVISKGHFVDLIETDDNFICDMFVVAKRMAMRIEDRLKPMGGIQVVANMCGAEELFHTHIHVIPFYKAVHRKRPVFSKNPELTQKDRKKLISILSK